MKINFWDDILGRSNKRVQVWAIAAIRICSEIATRSESLVWRRRRMNRGEPGRKWGSDWPGWCTLDVANSQKPLNNPTGMRPLWAQLPVLMQHHGQWLVAGKNLLNTMFRTYKLIKINKGEILWESFHVNHTILVLFFIF